MEETLTIEHELLKPTVLKVYASNFNFSNTSKYIIFDMDGTLITTKGKHKFAKDANDWQYINTKVKSLLSSLHQDGYTIIIITNQASVGTSKKKNYHVSYNRVKDLITNIITDLELPVCAFALLDKDVWRKPNSTIFESYIYPNLDKNNVSYISYVGDAAGRNGDHSDVDRTFLENIKLFIEYEYKINKIHNLPIIEFKTEKEFYDNLEPNTESYTYSSYYPCIIENKNNHTLDDLYSQLDKTDKRFIIIMVGMPACGKSYVANAISYKYKDVNIINQDTLKTKSKCLGKYKHYLREGYNVVIDNTNSSAKTRKEYLDLLSDYDGAYDTYIIEFKHDNYDLIQHLNRFRERKIDKKRIPRVAYNMFKKYYQQPGLDEVNRVFILEPFSGYGLEGMDKLYFMQKSHD